MKTKKRGRPKSIVNLITEGVTQQRKVKSF
jgi:hypothetical protein